MIYRESHSTIRYMENQSKFMFHVTNVIEGSGALVNEAGEETPLKAGDFALVIPDEKHQYRNKGDQPFKMICGVPKEFE
jgi:quercetin dioxygenase-like cupin family protein